ncbi:MAG: rhodanese-like domain-containing protein, partial [Myxococcales bacterium]|nr:rhodanese-like domain-containing protein [Myxococcales bacterium]
ALTWVSPADARPLLGTAGVVFVDARDRAEYRSGHVAGSVHTPVVGGVVRDGALEPLRGATTVVAYCDSSEQCARSVRLAGILTEAGFPDVRVLEGGFPAWLDAGYPAEAGEH